MARFRFLSSPYMNTSVDENMSRLVGAARNPLSILVMTNGSMNPTVRDQMKSVGQ